MKNAVLFCTALLASSLAVAGPTCKAPKDTWMKEADFLKQIEAQKYEVKNFKITKEGCYEIYGIDKGGKKVEIYFDPATGKPIQTHS